MGIYDRDYYRQGRSGFRLRAPRSAVGAIILLNVAVYLVEVVQFESYRPEMADRERAFRELRTPDAAYKLREAMSGAVAFADWLSVHVDAADRHDDTLARPWMWWQFLTYGFAHSPFTFQHIFFNMLVLFFLGRDVEQWYGTREFIRLYLVMLVFASLVFTLTTRLFDPQNPTPMYGASGAISGVIVLYALNFPKRMMLFMFILPMPAWLMGAIVVAIDIWGATFPGPGFGTRIGIIDPHTAFTAHLGGAAFALAYFTLRWNIGQFFASAATWLKGRTRPSLKVFKPEDEPDAHVADEEVDRILEKIHREGEGSLTRKERRILENASREYQRRRRPE